MDGRAERACSRSDSTSMHNDDSTLRADEEINKPRSFADLMAVRDSRVAWRMPYVAITSYIEVT